MATSSKYIQLSSSVLMEYVYSDQSQINVVGNPFRINTNTAPIWKMANGHNNQDQIMNSDSSEIVQDGLPIGTGNVRNRSFAIIEPYKTALLDIDKIVFYNDYDPLLTKTANLPISFTNPQAPVYDTIKLHLVQGFNFEENKALILSVKAKKKDGSTFILGNIVYNKTDVWETMNPSPFFFGGRVYNSYLEIRVLSLYNLIYDYWLGNLTGDTVVERITNFNGVKRDQQIQIYFSWVSEEVRIDSQDYLTLTGTKAVDLPVRDQFETIAAYIGESDAGDYIEFYGTYNGEIIENYMIDLRNSVGDYIILHDLVISEYVYDFTNSTYNWIRTDELQLSQIGEWDKPNVYRPVIKNNAAISFKIDYTVRLYNRDDNSQVWKTASMISPSAAKYGRYLKTINLGSNPVQTKIYNQRVVKDISINRITEPVVNNIRYITSLSNNANISITTETINPAPGATSDSTSLVNTQSTIQGNGSGTSNLQVFNNGLARVLIPESTAFLKFTLFQKVNGQNSTMNLSGLGDLYIVFKSQEGDNVEFTEFPNQYTSKGNGEVVFRLAEKESKKVLALTDRSFQIFLENESGDRTFLYSGKFYSVTEYQELVEKNKIANLENQVTNLSSQINDLTALSTLQQNKISAITLENTNLQNSLATAISEDMTDDAQAKAALDTQQETIRNLQNQISDLNTQISTLTKSLQTSTAALANANGLSQTSTIGRTTSDINIDDFNRQLGALNQNKAQEWLNSNSELRANIKNTAATNMINNLTGSVTESNLLREALLRIRTR